ncbi:MAG: helix-turn-helix domain-containing protein [Flavobacteriaceae bacterium]|jgi:transcriptional regulator with XRE-family HTH domain|nr:helix-turn-helix domain-containing protein [Flavobacteriaceae bacterium]
MEIGTRLRELRIQKGFSQEELANRSGVTLRTIQRIEKGDNEPRGNTLQMLCAVLEINVADLVVLKKTADNSVIKTMYLSVLAGIVVPLGNIILPTIIWHINKEKVKEAKSVGKHIIWSQVVLGTCSSLLIMFWIFIGLQQGVKYDALIYVSFLIGIVNYAIALYAFFQIDKKEKRYYYIPLFK